MEKGEEEEEEGMMEGVKEWKGLGNTEERGKRKEGKRKGIREDGRKQGRKEAAQEVRERFRSGGRKDIKMKACEERK